MSNRRHRLGLTLIELLVVLAVAALIGVSVSFGTVRVLSQGYFTNTVDRITRTLRTAQIYSISGRDESSWGVHYGDSALILFKGTNFATRDSSFDVSTPLPSSVSITGWSDISFDRLRGTPASTPTILIEVLGRAGAVSVGPEGAINRP